ncbi:M20/M25/M40 family metallo-hydrolase [Rhodococcus sp. IEGM 1366]|uniref:M20 family metallopeptidase n=1 Tax=Rhodococcus sp. IEGM 1366 TaxID=3082223 RepID=UPI0029542275|nr:M20/M25/M40 family metallo-hydrolase [Rhodococcus sp. IEGM 1366]MDV8071471.1 M20/M25/M40 family metallo-hydrolase [Rhodococcus sp. IEGM 1366]
MTVSSQSDTRLAAAVDASRESMLDFLSATVQRCSVSGHEDRVSDLYEQFFHTRGWTVTTQTLESSRVSSTPRGSQETRREERANVLGYFRTPRGLPTVVLNGHIDVVPVLDEPQWDRPPFSGDRTDGYVHGRGSVDTKGGIAAALFALDALDSIGVELPFDVAVELVVGEETTGVGTQAALERIPDRMGTIVLEPTDCAIVPLASGLLFFTVELTGRAAHTSVPWHGVDAGPKLIRIYQALTELGCTRAKTHTHPLMPFPSAVPFAIGSVQIGGWRAAVPAKASMSGRIGVLPGEDLATVRQALIECVRAASEGDEWLAQHPAVVKWDHDGAPSWETPATDAIVESMISGQHRAGIDERIEGMTAGCDAGILISAGVPTVVFGPGDMRFAHSPNERIAEPDVVSAAEVLAHMLVSWSEREELNEKLQS